MRLSGKNPFPAAGLAVLLLLALTVCPATPARAASEDVAMFYDSLSPYGAWVDYGNYGPVWYPTQGVTSNWRPYVDGRWQPTSEGWVFETGEPWGWATYHWGNWMPSTEYGWVWSPGSTWYPSTAVWRTSDEYIGWAPTPPPNYVPQPAYYPAGGYYSGMPVTDLISAPFWIFAQAANFLLGFNRPYLPAYSYYNTGYLAPYSYVPVAFASSLFLSNFYYPFYAPRAFYSFGPSFPFVSRVTNINIANINNFARNANIGHFRNGLPPAAVLNKHPFIGQGIPGQVREGQRFQVHQVSNPAQVRGQLARPGVMKPPADVPKLTKEIPKGAAPAGRGPTPSAVGAPKGGPAPTGVVKPRGPSAPEKGRPTPPTFTGGPKGGPAPEVLKGPGRGTPAPAREVTPTREKGPPTGVFRAPGRESRTPAAKSGGRGTTMPPSSEQSVTPRMQRQIQQQRRQGSGAAPRLAPAAPRTAPSAPRAAPAAPRSAPSAPAVRPSAPAPAPGGGGGGRGGGAGGGGRGGR